MADIELVIKISNYDKEWITNGYCIPEEINTRIAESIAKGTPLPKGHGRLIDEEVLHHKISEWLKPQKPDETEMVDLADIAVSTMMEIEEADTIIEADTESEE